VRLRQSSDSGNTDVTVSWVVELRGGETQGTRERCWIQLAVAAAMAKSQ
jgi:hypothetical protein